MKIRHLATRWYDRMISPVRMTHLAAAAFVLLAPAATVGSCSFRTHRPPRTTVPQTTVPPSTSPAMTLPLNTPGDPSFALRVSGNSFVDGKGQKIQLRGVNRPSVEYRCVQNIPYGFITDDNSLDGRNANYIDDAVAALTSWNEPGAAGLAINTVRIPLNEDCWFGINGAAPEYSGAPYQMFVKALADRLTEQGVYVILDLHWSAPGSFLANQQDIGPNADHSVAFWKEVATVFKDRPSVGFDLFNEPHLWCNSSACKADYAKAAATAWACYRDGCNYTYTNEDWINGRTSGTIQIAGTQQLVDTIRATGARNVILVAGLGYANAFDNWVKFKPADPLNQIAASLHTYTSSGANVNNTTYLDGMLAVGGLSSNYPILVGEFGEWLCSAGTTGFTEATMDWADAHGYSYTAWGWDKGEGCNGPSLVSSNTGTPTPFGAIVKAHLQERAR